jgi:hypothetical protein
MLKACLALFFISFVFGMFFFFDGDMFYEFFSNFGFEVISRFFLL